MPQPSQRPLCPRRQGLKAIRAWRWMFWASLIMAAFFVSLTLIPSLKEEYSFHWLFEMSIALCLTNYGFVIFSRCPNCRRFFHQNWLWTSLFTKSCLNCRQNLNE